MGLRRFSFIRRDFFSNLAIVWLLAVGLGATALLNTALDRLLLHPLKVSHPETLVRFAVKGRQYTFRQFPYSVFDGARALHSVQEVTAEADFDTIVARNGHPEKVIAHLVSGSYFSLLQGTPQLGRALGHADDTASASGIPVVLSHRFWMHEYAGNSAVLGKPLQVRGTVFTIVGVMPQSFFGSSLDSSPDFWLPLSAGPSVFDKPVSDPESPQSFWILARAKPGTSIRAAEQEFAGYYKLATKEDGMTGEPIVEPIALGAFSQHDQFAPALSLLLFGLAALLLMISASVAGMLLARSLRAARSIAIQLALGARRSLLVRNALMEAMALGLVGAGGGVVVAYVCAPWMMRLLPAGRSPLPVSLVPDLRALLLIVGIAVLISVVFGLAPALRIPRAIPSQLLRGGTTTGRSGSLRRGLLIFQTSITVALLVATGLLLHTFYSLLHARTGYDLQRVIVFTLDTSVFKNNENSGSTAKTALPWELQRRVQSLPGVVDASLAGAGLMQRIGIKSSVALPGHTIQKTDFLNSSLNEVSPSFFHTMGVPLVAGRTFAESDANTKEPTPVVINQAFARKFFGTESAVGKLFGQDRPGKIATAKYQVVGVVGDSKYRSLREEMLPIYYLPMSRDLAWGGSYYLYVRTQAPSAGIIDLVKSSLYSLESRLPFYDIVTLKEEAMNTIWQERLLSVLAMIFSAIAVLMSATGLYGLLSYDANQRRREFGVRYAVGAQRRHVLRLIAMDLARMVVPGVLLGTLLCLAASRSISALLYGVGPFDPVSFGLALMAIVLIGLISAWQPALRAMHVSPSVVLREE